MHGRRSHMTTDPRGGGYELKQRIKLKVMITSHFFSSLNSSRKSPTPPPLALVCFSSRNSMNLLIRECGLVLVLCFLHAYEIPTGNKLLFLAKKRVSYPCSQGCSRVITGSRSLKQPTGGIGPDQVGSGPVGFGEPIRPDPPGLTRPANSLAYSYLLPALGLVELDHPRLPRSPSADASSFRWLPCLVDVDLQPIVALALGGFFLCQAACRWGWQRGVFHVPGFSRRDY